MWKWWVKNRSGNRIWFTWYVREVVQLMNEWVMNYKRGLGACLPACLALPCLPMGFDFGFGFGLWGI